MPADELVRIVHDHSLLEGVRFMSDGEAVNGSVLLKQTEAARGEYTDYQKEDGPSADGDDNEVKEEEEDHDEKEEGRSKKKKVKTEDMEMNRMKMKMKATRKTREGPCQDTHSLPLPQMLLMHPSLLSTDLQSIHKSQKTSSDGSALCRQRRRVD